MINNIYFIIENELIDKQHKIAKRNIPVYKIGTVKSYLQFESYPDKPIYYRQSGPQYDVKLKLDKGLECSIITYGYY